MSKIKKPTFAEGWRDIYLQAQSQHLKTDFWELLKRRDLEKIMRISQYHYKKQTGKNIEL